MKCVGVIVLSMLAACCAALPQGLVTSKRVLSRPSWATGALTVRGGARDLNDEVDEVKNNWERYVPLLAALPCYVLGGDLLLQPEEAISRYHEKDLKDTVSVISRGEKTLGMFGGLSNLLLGAAITAVVWQGGEDNIKIANALALGGCASNELLQQAVNHNEDECKPLKTNFSNFMTAYRVVSGALSLWALLSIKKDEDDRIV